MFSNFDKLRPKIPLYDITEAFKTTNIRMIKQLKYLNIPIFLTITKLEHLYIQIYQKITKPKQIYIQLLQ